MFNLPTQWALWGILFGSLTLASASTNFAANLASCTNNQELDVCLRNTLEELRRLMPVGIPELGLNASEPLHISNLHFLRRLEPVVVDSVLSDVEVSGLSKFETKSISTDTKGQTLSLEIFVPEINIHGRYGIKGKVFVFPISGEGPFKARLRGITGSGGAKIVVVNGPENQKHLSIQETSIDFDIKDIYLNMENLFGGAEKLFADTVNKFLNDNSDVILREIKPQIKSRMITIIDRVLNDAFSQLPADDLINNIHSRRSG
uniref:Takeout n=1 Tax=Caligus clemensi TaxID=344056 RepID=C1C0F8_CALCM|nr:takeout precursor [Caligus clemensi]